MIELEPGEMRRYDLELGVLAGSDEIEAFAAHVAALHDNTVEV